MKFVTLLHYIVALPASLHACLEILFPLTQRKLNKLTIAIASFNAGTNFSELQENFCGLLSGETLISTKAYTQIKQFTLSHTNTSVFNI